MIDILQIPYINIHLVTFFSIIESFLSRLGSLVLAQSHPLPLSPAEQDLTGHLWPVDFCRYFFRQQYLTNTSLTVFCRLLLVSELSPSLRWQVGLLNVANITISHHKLLPPVRVRFNTHLASYPRYAFHKRPHLDKNKIHEPSY